MIAMIGDAEFVLTRLRQTAFVQDHSASKGYGGQADHSKRSKKC